MPYHLSSSDMLLSRFPLIDNFFFMPPVILFGGGRLLFGHSGPSSCFQCVSKSSCSANFAPHLTQMISGECTLWRCSLKQAIRVTATYQDRAELGLLEAGDVRKTNPSGTGYVPIPMLDASSEIFRIVRVEGTFKPLLRPFVSFCFLKLIRVAVVFHSIPIF